MSLRIGRRSFLSGALAYTLSTYCQSVVASGSGTKTAEPPYLQKQLLSELPFGSVTLANETLARKQFDHTMAVIMSLDEDSLLRPFRMRSGLPAPGIDLGGWYDAWDGTDIFHEIERGFAPGHCLGQWISALARAHAITGSSEMKQKLQRLIAEYAKIPAQKYYEGLRYPGYTYDKFVCAFIDAKTWAGQENAFSLLDDMTDKVLPLLPERVLSQDELHKLPHIDESYCWDELYTLPENLYLAFQNGAGDRYKEIAHKYLKDDAFFKPLSEGKNALPGVHAYSHCNALSSAIQAYLTEGSQTHLDAASNGLNFIQEQSFATGGWGPNESFVLPGKGYLAKSLNDSHKSFETPCGAYAHLKLCRYLLRITKQSKYGDSLEKVFYNTVLGAKPLQPDGRGFYYSDYNFHAEKYYRYAWTCCTGSLPQVVCDYHRSAYFLDPSGIYVNLFLPSEAKFKRDTTEYSITQETNYPFEETVKIKLASKGRAKKFTVYIRIPEHCPDKAYIAVNGEAVSTAAYPGSFSALSRTWSDQDEIEVALPTKLHLHPLSAENQEIVALCFGPLALFAITDDAPAFKKQALLEAKRIKQDEWQVESPKGAITFKPFTSIDKEVYSLYLKTSS